MKKFIYGIFSLFLIGLIIIAVSFYWINLELKKAGPLTTDKLFSIKQGTSVSNIAKDLKKNNIITKDWLFILGTRISGDDKYLRAGEYTIPTKANIVTIIEVLARGKQHQYSITIPEGLNSYQLIDIINKNPVLIGDISITPKDGTLLPETYHFTRGTTRNEIIARMKNKMRKTLKAEWETREKDLPIKNAKEAIILASIIEKETGIGSERAKVAGVFINRLNKGMKLQTDPTVIYAVTNGGKNPLNRPLYTKDLAQKHPYNTYQIIGLPPGAICHPGYESIKATLHPEKHDYIYFVANGTGGHTFSKTLKEHNRNVAKWRKFKKSQKN